MGIGALVRHVEGVYGTGFPTLEALFCDEGGFLGPQASPLQRAICRVVDGALIDGLWDDEGVREAFGGVCPEPGQPRELVIMSGIRTGKSLLAAAIAFHATQKCDFSGLGPGEIPRVSVVSLSTDLGQVVFNHLIGNLQQRPRLRGFLARDPGSDTVFVRHPSGRLVEITVVAGSRAGGSLVARWSAGVIFDEAPRMVGGSDGVVNLDDMRAAVLERLRPGAQIVYPGSPWAPYGPIYEKQQQYFGRPSRDVIVVKAPSYVMNPVYWTPERVKEAELRDPDVANTDIHANFADPETNWFSAATIDRCTRSDPQVLQPEEGLSYAAAMDPATRGNAWTLTLTTQKGGKLLTVLATQWIGSKLNPLDPRDIMKEVAEICFRYGVSSVMTDQWSFDAMRAIAADCGLILVEDNINEDRKYQLFRQIATLAVVEGIELPPDPQVRRDLLSVKRRVSPTGKVSVILPHTADGRHCDYAASVVMALALWVDTGSTSIVQETETQEDEDEIREAMMLDEPDYEEAGAEW